MYCLRCPKNVKLLSCALFFPFAAVLLNDLKIKMLEVANYETTFNKKSNYTRYFKFKLYFLDDIITFLKGWNIKINYTINSVDGPNSITSRKAPVLRPYCAFPDRCRNGWRTQSFDMFCWLYTVRGFPVPSKRCLLS